MPSDKQIAANQANAKKSTGPRTRAGRARSSQNAVKHGFSSPDYAVIRLEDCRDLERLRADFISVYQPVNAVELCAVERLAVCHQALMRTYRLEAGLLTDCLNTVLTKDDKPALFMNPDIPGVGDIEVLRSQNRNFLLGEGFMMRTSAKPMTFTLFLRYQAQAERQYRRAVEEFDRLKKQRNELPNEPIWKEQLKQKKAPEPPTDDPDKPKFPPQLDCLSPMFQFKRKLGDYAAPPEPKTPPTES